MPEDADLKSGIEVTPAARENLGIRFVEVERRAITATRRIPGVFEFMPSARHEYRAMLAGRATLHVQQFDKVERGDLLLSINSPQWRQIQHNAVEAEGEITMAEAMLDVTKARRAEANASLAKVNGRLKNLASAGVSNANLEAEAAALRNSLPRLEAEVRAQEAAVREAHEHYESRLRTLSSVTGIDIGDLTANENGHAAWREITEIELRAAGPGVIEDVSINDGGWLEEGALALTTADPTAIRFHAEAPQSDIAYYREGQKARIVSAQGGSVDMKDAMTGTIRLGVQAHVEDRTLSLYVTPDSLSDWARAGVSAYLEVTVSDDVEETWAIPKSAVIQDGIETIFYRRNPDDPNRVLRVVADLGESDGRWVAVMSGLKKGDEVVNEGAYALSLSGAGSQAPEGYHYHADGSLHKDH